MGRDANTAVAAGTMSRASSFATFLIIGREFCTSNDSLGNLSITISDYTDLYFPP